MRWMYVFLVALNVLLVGLTAAAGKWVLATIWALCAAANVDHGGAQVQRGVVRSLLHRLRRSWHRSVYFCDGRHCPDHCDFTFSLRMLGRSEGGTGSSPSPRAGAFLRSTGPAVVPTTAARSTSAA